MKRTYYCCLVVLALAACVLPACDRVSKESYMDGLQLPPPPPQPRTQLANMPWLPKPIPPPPPGWIIGPSQHEPEGMECGADKRIRDLSLPVSVVEPYTWQNTYPDIGITQGDPGASAFISFRPRERGISTTPDAYLLKISLAPKYRQGWRVMTALGYTGDRYAISRKPRAGDGEPPEDKVAFLVSNEFDYEGQDASGVHQLRATGDLEKAYQLRKVFWDGIGPNELCTLHLKLHHDGTGVSFDKLKTAIETDGDGVLQVRTAYLETED